MHARIIDGKLIVRADTTQEKLDALHVLNGVQLDNRNAIGTAAWHEAIRILSTNDPHEFTTDRRWGRFSAMHHQVGEPYQKLLAERTGFEGGLDAPMPQLDDIAATGIIQGAYLYADGLVTAEIFLPYYRDDTDDDRMEKRANRYLLRLLAEQQLEPEFIQMRNGAYKRNPDYATGKEKFRLTTSNEIAWAALWNAWLLEKATPAQAELLAKIIHTDAPRPRDPLPYSFRAATYGSLCVDDPQGTVNWDGKGRMVRRITWTEIAQLGKPA